MTELFDGARLLLVFWFTWNLTQNSELDLPAESFTLFWTWSLQKIPLWTWTINAMMFTFILGFTVTVTFDIGILTKDGKIGLLLGTDRKCTSSIQNIQRLLVFLAHGFHRVLNHLLLQH